MRKRRLFPLVVVIVLAGFANGAPMARAETKHVLSLDEAKRLIAAAHAAAVRIGAPGAIAVVDDGGWVIAEERMDQTPMLVSAELAPGKARAAAIFRKPTAELEKAIDDGRAAQITVPDVVQMQGGLPLTVDGLVVGAIGVSADTPAHDQQIAEAGANALQVIEQAHYSSLP